MLKYLFFVMLLACWSLISFGKIALPLSEHNFLQKTNEEKAQSPNSFICNYQWYMYRSGYICADQSYYSRHAPTLVYSVLLYIMLWVYLSIWLLLIFVGTNTRPDSLNNIRLKVSLWLKDQVFFIAIALVKFQHLQSLHASFYNS